MNAAPLSKNETNCDKQDYVPAKHKFSRQCKKKDYCPAKQKSNKKCNRIRETKETQENQKSWRPDSTQNRASKNERDTFKNEREATAKIQVTQETQN